MVVSRKNRTFAARLNNGKKGAGVLSQLSQLFWGEGIWQGRETSVVALMAYLDKQREKPKTELLSSAVRTRLELATPCVTGMYSNQAELPHQIMSASSRALPLSFATAKVRHFRHPTKHFGNYFSKNLNRLILNGVMDCIYGRLIDWKYKIHCQFLSQSPVHRHFFCHNHCIRLIKPTAKFSIVNSQLSIINYQFSIKKGPLHL